MSDLYNFYRGKKVVVTGASGFIGSYLCKILAPQDCQVVALVRPNSNLWRLDTGLENLKIAATDLTSTKEVHELISDVRPDHIFHFAIPPHSELKTVDDLAFQIHVASSHITNLYEAINRSDLNASFIHACSGAVYDWSPESFVLKETTNIAPSTLRGKLKAKQRDLCFELSNKYEIDTKLARVFRAYGPWEVSSKLIVKALDAHNKQNPILLGSNQYKRDYIYVSDLVEGILRLGSSALKSGTEINFGSNSQFSAYEIVSILERILEAEIPKKINAYTKNNYDQGKFVADCTLAKELLGWVPRVSIEAGLMETIEWYNQEMK